MKRTPFPVGLGEVWAKSAERDEKRGESLPQHTWNVLSKLSDLVRLRPDLPGQLGVPRLWYRLFLAAWLHDLGKSATGFQAMVHDGVSWGGLRHEVLSLAFVSWLDIADSDDRLWIASVVASHHKDPTQIRSYLGDGAILQKMVDEVPQETLGAIWDWLDGCAEGWIRDLDLTTELIEIPPLLAKDTALNRFKRDGARDIGEALVSYINWADPWLPEYDSKAKTAQILLRGLIVQADHNASAHSLPIEGARVDGTELLAKWKWSPEQLRNHQREAAAQEGSALLVAPTGSGKTEAALLWAARQAGKDGKLPRLFYTLPYQASMNAMHRRLEASFAVGTVGLQHGRSLLALYRQWMERGYGKTEAMGTAKRFKNLGKLNHQPIRVFSPYQMLKGFYRLKGYEPVLTDYYSASFIFDEIHAYDPERLALILESVAHLRRYYDARFLVMSATFPQLIRTKLQEVLGGEVPLLRANAAVFTEFRRHCPHLLAGDLLDDSSLDTILAEAAAGKSVLVCCNTVARAQELYSRLNGVEKVLLHGRFNSRDRLEKEKRVQQATGVGSKERRPIILVATQVVEVSLNIDLHTIYSDPAPLEALVQRFGRVNRERKQKGLADVYVYRLPDDGQGIYDPDLVAGALGVLERIDGQPLDEAAVGGWLDEIYRNDVAVRWEAKYREQADSFRRALVDTLRAFNVADDMVEQNFNKLFDGIEVLPVNLKGEYVRLRDEEGEVEASDLLVSIRYGQYCALKNAEKIEREPDVPPIALASYSSEEGLRLND